MYLAIREELPTPHAGIVLTNCHLVLTRDSFGNSAANPWVYSSDAYIFAFVDMTVDAVPGAGDVVFKNIVLAIGPQTGPSNPNTPPPPTKPPAPAPGVDKPYYSVVSATAVG